MSKRSAVVITLAALIGGTVAVVLADTVPARQPRPTFDQLVARVQELEARVTKLESSPPPSDAPAGAAPAAAGQEIAKGMTLDRAVKIAGWPAKLQQIDSQGVKYYTLNMRDKADSTDFNEAIQPRSLARRRHREFQRHGPQLTDPTARRASEAPIKPRGRLFTGQRGVS